MRYININKINDRIRNIMIIVLFTGLYFITSIYAKNVYAATGFRIYDYATKKTTSYNGVVPTVTLNGSKIGDDRAKGILVNGVALLPYDTIFEASAIAADCSYDKSKESVTISKYGNEITLTVGSKTATVNGKRVTMSVAPMKVKYPDSGLTKILVPSRFVSENLGLGYTWYSNISTIAIEKKTITLSYNDAEKFEYADLQTKVTIDGQAVDLGKMPGIIVNNIAMLRAKKVFSDSAIGAAYSYDKSSKKLTLKKDDKTLIMTIGSKTAYFNDQKITLDNAPMIVTNHENGTSYVMVPGRNTATYLSYDYVWDKAAATSRITGKKTSAPSTNNSDNGGNISAENNTPASDTVNNNSGNNTDNSANNNQSNNSDNNTANANGSNIEPELGDDRVYAQPGTILHEWKTDELSFGISSGIHELPGNTESNYIIGQVYYTSNNYISKKSNCDTFMFASNIPLADISSYSNGGSIRIAVKNFSCYDQIYQLLSTDSKLVDTISMINNPGSNEAIIELNVIRPEYQYDISISENKQYLYVTVYENVVISAELGVNDEGDYITLSGLMPLKAEITDNSGQIFIKLPGVINGLGDLNHVITGTRFIRNMLSATVDEGTYIALVVDPGYEYYFIENDALYTLCIRPEGYTDVESENDDAETVTEEPEENEEPVTDKSRYEIIIPRPENVKRSMITDEDFYHEGYFVIRIKGDYTEFYKDNVITNKAKTVKQVTVSYKADGYTEIKLITTKLQGYKIATDSEAIYVHVGEPRDIYKNIVVLDPGHGGEAKGAQHNGSKEKDINLKILYTIGKKYFNSDTSKLKVYYTRYTDVDMSLSERAAFASKVGADLFVSLHMNAAEGVPVARGSEVFYSVKNNNPNKAGLNSQKLAQMLNTNIYTLLGTKDRGVKTENHTVTYRNTVPAVLIELGFMSNTEDYAMLTDEAFQDKAAKVIYDTLLEVFKQYPTGRK